jgi:hypothetical protein
MMIIICLDVIRSRNPVHPRNFKAQIWERLSRCVSGFSAELEPAPSTSDSRGSPYPFAIDLEPGIVAACFNVFAKGLKLCFA